MAFRLSGVDRMSFLTCHHFCFVAKGESVATGLGLRRRVGSGMASGLATAEIRHQQSQDLHEIVSFKP